MNISTPRFTAAMVRLTPWPFVSYGFARLATFLAPFAVLLIEQRFFNALGTSLQTTTMWWFVATYAAVCCIRLLCVLVECWTNITFRYRAMGVLQQNTIAYELERPGALPRTVLPLEHLNRLRDDAGEVADFPLWLPEVLGTTIATACALVMMWRVDAGLTMVAIAPLLIQGLAALVFWRVYLHYRYEAGRLDDAYSTLIGTIIGTAQSIRLLALQSVFLGQLDDLGSQRRRNAMRQIAYEQLSTSSLVAVSVAIACALSLWYAVPELASLRIGVGDLLLFFSGLSIVAALPQTWATFIGDYAQQRVSIGRLTEAMSDTPQSLIRPLQWWHSPARTSFPPRSSETLDTLHIKRLTYHHPDGRGITDVSFAVHRGTLTVITGRVGSGKSTLLNLCAGLLDAQSGSFVWNAEVYTSMRGRSVASVPQLPFLFSASLHENICLGIDAAHLPDIVEASMLSRDIATMPAGLATVVGPRGMRLSGGQRQRVALARALIRRHELLVLDDISSALDAATEAALLKKLQQHHTGTIVASSTRPALLAAADTIIVLEEGQIAGVGTLAMLLQTNPTMQALWADYTHPSSSPLEQRIDATATTE